MQNWQDSMRKIEWGKVGHWPAEVSADHLQKIKDNFRIDVLPFQLEVSQLVVISVRQAIVSEQLTQTQ